ncbi:MlaD family protein [Nocardia callitridis]|uniref:Mce/MlaD domain-containing protein n=1 Tax=Nocardia callitridis TaxID=648753 RepID=A0ABP9KS79_9NOCA
MNLRGAVSLSAIAAVLVLGVAYMAVGVLHVDPRRSFHTAEMHIANSGGLGPNSPVLLEGTQVGKTETVRKIADGVLVRIRIEDRYRIPASSIVRIEQLSALGEPYIEFSPTTDGGPYLRDGEVIATDQIRTPTTISALSTRLVALLDKIHPDAVANLVGTADTALTGTDAAMQTLRRSSDLLAATLLSRNASLRQLFSDMQAMGADMAWLGPSLTTAGPQFGEFGTRLTAIVESGSVLSGKRPVQDYFTGDGLVPFLGNLTRFLAEIGPAVAPLAPALQPVVTQSVGNAAPFDISALIDQALRGVDPEGTLHFRINVK